MSPEEQQVRATNFVSAQVAAEIAANGRDT